MRRGEQRETLARFSERAIQAMYDGKLIPPLVYVPMALRKSQKRYITEITTTPHTVEENDARIAAADPLGMLIAIMQGQPIPTFCLNDVDGNIVVTTEYSVPDLNLRAEVAWQLVEAKRRSRGARVRDYDEWDTIVEGAANGIRKTDPA